MPRRNRKRSALDSEFAKPIGALMLLGLLWGAYQIGAVSFVAETLVGMLNPR